MLKRQGHLFHLLVLLKMTYIAWVCFTFRGDAKASLAGKLGVYLDQRDDQHEDNLFRDTGKSNFVVSTCSWNRPTLRSFIALRHLERFQYKRPVASDFTTFDINSLPTKRNHNPVRKKYNSNSTNGIRSIHHSNVNSIEDFPCHLLFFRTLSPLILFLNLLNTLSF